MPDMSHEQEGSLLTRIDLKLIPFLSSCYLLAYLDRSNIANARITNASTGQNIDASLQLTDHQLSWAISIFFVGYILLEVPSNLALKRFKPSRWLARIIFTWGVSCIIMGFVRDFWGLFAIRFLLGAFEAGFYPGVIFYLTFWYKSQERAKRFAWFYCSSSLAGVVGGLLAYGISFLNNVGGLEGWRWIFILEGIPTTLAGITCWFYLPDFPETCTFLSKQEKQYWIQRLSACPQGVSSMHDKHFDIKQFKNLVTNLNTYLFALGFFLKGLNILPKILVGNGFKDMTAQLLSVPPYLVAFISILLVSSLSDRYQNRVLPIVGAAVVQIIGFLGMWLAPGMIPKYLFAILACAGVYTPSPCYLSWLTAHHQGSTQSSIITAMVVASGSFGAVLNPFIYPSWSAPHYTMGYALNTAAGVILIFIVLILEYRLNRVKE